MVVNTLGRVTKRQFGVLKLMQRASNTGLFSFIILEERSVRYFDTILVLRPSQMNYAAIFFKSLLRRETIILI